jgi:hypothetical protein
MNKNPNVDVAYFEDQLKTNVALKDMVIKLAVHRRLNLEEYKPFLSVDGLERAQGLLS